MRVSCLDRLLLGYIISQGQVEMDPSKVSAVAEWPSPSTRKRLQQFLGFANFYRRFIRGYSQVAAPLTALTSTKNTFAWSLEAETAFQGLKRRFISAPILVQPDPSLQFVVEVDASVSPPAIIRRPTASQRGPTRNWKACCAVLPPPTPPPGVTTFPG